MTVTDDLLVAGLEELADELFQIYDAAEAADATPPIDRDTVINDTIAAATIS